MTKYIEEILCYFMCGKTDLIEGYGLVFNTTFNNISVVVS